MTLLTLDDSHIRIAARLALLVCVLAIAYLAFAPLTAAPLGGNDKLSHFLAFWVLAWLADCSYPGRRLEPYRWAYLLGYGLMIEVIQGFLSYREFSLLDLGADAIGILGYSAVQRIRKRTPCPE